MMNDKSAKKVVPRELLNKESVIIAAVKLADKGGLQSLSMRKLGSALGVEGMALYHHFPNKEALVDAMVDSVHSEIEVPVDNQDWRVAMYRRAISGLDALSRHQWAAPLMESRHNPGEASMRLIDATVKCLLDAGFSIEMIAHTVSVLDSYIFGFAQQLRPSESAEQSAQMGKDFITRFPFGKYPYVGKLVTEYVLKSSYRTRAEFEFGLNLILDGIEELKKGLK